MQLKVICFGSRNDYVRGDQNMYFFGALTYLWTGTVTSPSVLWLNAMYDPFRCYNFSNSWGRKMCEDGGRTNI